MPGTANSTATNQSAAIFKLPDDVLSLVFLHGLDWQRDFFFDNEEEESNNEEVPNHSSLASLEHGRTLASVCQYWRQLSLNTVQLWSNISLDKPEYAAELVRRTRRASLGIFCIFPSPTPEAFWEGVSELLPQCMDRMQNLRIVLQKHHDDERFWSLLSHPQALRKLTVTGSGYPEAGAPHFLSKNIPLDKMTSLRSLSLYAACLQQDLPPIPTLERFVVTDNSEEDSAVTDELEHQRLSVAWLLRSLPNIPNVEVVDAGVVFAGYPERHRAIKLPKLCILRLLCADITVSSIFEYLDVRDTIIVYFMFDYKTHTVPVKTDGMAALFSRYFTNHTTTELFLSVSILNDDEGDVDGPQVLALVLNDDDAGLIFFATDFLHHLFSDYIGLFPLEKLYTLEYNTTKKGGTVDKWVEMTAMCPNLRKLVLETSSGIDFLRRYTDRYLRSRDPKDGLVNPQLSTLGFKMVDFEVGGKTTADFAIVVESLREMKRAGAPLERVALNQCTISQVSVTKLEESIPVEWDGVEKGYKILSIHGQIITDMD